MQNSTRASDDGRGIHLHEAAPADRRTDDLRILQQRNNLLFHLPGILFELDLEGRYTRMEGRLLDDLGVAERNFLGRRVVDVYGNEPSVEDGLRSVLSGERPSASFLVHAFDRWWDIHIAALHDRDNEIESVTGIALDISDKLAAAAAQRASEVKSQFLTAMSHELRTPLTSVLGFTDLLLAKEAREKERHYLDNIMQSGRHLLHLVNDLLDLAKIEAGKLEIEMGTISVDQAVNNIVESMRPVAAEKGLALRTRVAPNLTVHADRLRLDQILLNLLSNAIKFTKRGSVTVRASRRGKGTVRISVTDTGPGISEEDQSQVWVEFTQLGFPSEGQGGTGLGLPLARRLAEHMGGRLDVESQVDCGTVFILELASSR